MNAAIRNGIAALALSFIGGGLAIFPDHRSLALVFCAVGGLFGLAVLVFTVIAERHFRAMRDAIAKALTDADELSSRKVSTEDEFNRWKADLNGWANGTRNFLAARVSAADAALFWDLSEGGRYIVRGVFNAEHGDLINVLGKYIRNLKSIADRCLTRH